MEELSAALAVCPLPQPDSKRAEPLLPAPVAKVEGVLWRDAAVTPMLDAIAEEVPVALSYNGVSHAVMMATPADLEDFALGFSLSEGIVEHAGEVRDIEQEETGAGTVLHVTISARRFAALKDRRRNLTGRTGCGLCGVDSLEHAIRPVPARSLGGGTTIDAIGRALRELPGLQQLNRVTRSLHAAAWADAGGGIALLREDIGRHNALDKLIGAMARAGVDTARGFGVVTSRSSYEMVQKAAAAGMPVLVAISAPTALAIRVAREAGVTLVALARADGARVYSHPQRIAAQ